MIFLNFLKTVSRSLKQALQPPNKSFWSYKRFMKTLFSAWRSLDIPETATAWFGVSWDSQKTEYLSDIGACDFKSRIMMHMICCISTNHKSILIRSTKRLETITMKPGLDNRPHEP